MTSLALAGRTASGPLTAAARWFPAIGLVAGLAVIVGGRWLATTRGIDALALGLVFGLALAALAVARGPMRRPSRARIQPLLIGVAAGLALVGVTLAGAAIAGTMIPPGLGRPAAPFLPWVAITILVATAEEVLLRGRLLDAIRRAGGLPVAIVLTTLAFALMHVPVYGWHVVPLDLAVGLGFAGLRLGTRSLVAPAAAHAVADLATWWL